MKPTIQQTTLDTITITYNNQSLDIPFDDALFVASELNKVWQADYDSLPFSEGVNEMSDKINYDDLGDLGFTLSPYEAYRQFGSVWLSCVWLDGNHKSIPAVVVTTENPEFEDSLLTGISLPIKTMTQLEKQIEVLENDIND